MTRQNRNAASQLSTGNKEAVSLATDYIRCLSEHLRYILSRTVSERDLKSIAFNFVVTVPTMWTEVAKDKTRIACMQALDALGEHKLVQLVSEPEAAAIFSLHGLKSHGLEVDDTIIIVDAGGGIVDLISYTISKLEPSLELVEAAPGSGGLFGSSFLNKRFADLLEQKIGHFEAFNAELRTEAMDTFEKTVGN